ncbi:DDE-domain-containing protein, partial [Gyrodon lividus]
SVSHSLKGWTDQELGLKWLQKDFEPQTAQQNQSDGYRLLILDGHNSHRTYEFCKFAADHHIIILCLPSHTTHVLQPLDVGIFGPLASAWKKQVNEASWQFIAIKMNNLLAYYKLTRNKAMLPTTIQSAFAKTGIHPLNLMQFQRMLMHQLLIPQHNLHHRFPQLYPVFSLSKQAQPPWHQQQCTLNLPHKMKEPIT